MTVIERSKWRTQLESAHAEIARLQGQVAAAHALKRLREDEIERLQESKRHFSALADAKGKENCELRAALETQRWHIKTGDAQELLICVGDHAKDAPCDFHRYRYVVEQT